MCAWKRYINFLVSYIFFKLNFFSFYNEVDDNHFLMRYSAGDRHSLKETLGNHLEVIRTSLSSLSMMVLGTQKRWVSVRYIKEGQLKGVKV